MSFEGFLKDEEGTSAVEYAVLLVLIASVILVAVASLGRTTSASYETVSSEAFALTSTDDKQDKCKDSPDDDDCGIGND